MFYYFRVRRSFTAIIVFCAAAFAVICLCAFSVPAPETNAFAPEEEGLPLPVLMYHSVCINKNASSPYILAPEIFEEDMRYLTSRGYRTVFFSDVINYVKNNGSLPDKPVIISIDDGFYNSLTNVLPILKKYDLLANVNVVGEFTKEGESDPNRSPAYSYLSWEDIRTLSGSGRIEIGSHSFGMHSTSPRNGCKIMPGETKEHYEETLKTDLSRLKDEMYEKTGLTANVFAYPFGAACEEAVPVLRSLGFEAALTCEEKINLLTRDNDLLFHIGRINRASGLTTEEFMEKYGIG